MEKTVVAVVGCGRIARNAHFPAFAKMDNVRVKYACDILLDKADKMKEDFPFIEQTITDYKQALADSEVEAGQPACRLLPRGHDDGRHRKRLWWRHLPRGVRTLPGGDLGRDRRVADGGQAGSDDRKSQGNGDRRRNYPRRLGLGQH